MKKFSRLLKDQSAGNQGIVFVIIFILVIVIFFSFLEPLKLSFTEWVLTISYKKGLDAMQQSGGLTAEIDNSLRNYMKNLGFNESGIQINGTPAPVDWGEDIGIEIKYDKEYNVYRLDGILTFTKETKSVQLVIEGSTTSYYFDNNYD